MREQELLAAGFVLRKKEGEEEIMKREKGVGYIYKGDK